MSTGTTVLLLISIGFVAWLSVLHDSSQKKERDELKRKGHLVQAIVFDVNVTEDVIVKYEFPLPDGKAIQRGSDMLTYGTQIRKGDKIIVRYNPMLPAVSKYVERV